MPIRTPWVEEGKKVDICNSTSRMGALLPLEKRTGRTIVARSRPKYKYFLVIRKPHRLEKGMASGWAGAQAKPEGKIIRLGNRAARPDVPRPNGGTRGNEGNEGFPCFTLGETPG